MKRSTIKRRKRVTAANLTTHKPMVYHPTKPDDKHTLRPLLPSPVTSPSPEPVEPDRYYLPSPPMIPHDDLPLPSSPLNMFQPVDSQLLEAHRNELKREVNNLTTLLSRTTAMLQNIDHVMATNLGKK
ncbi:hypothetical protein G6F68_017882 [Rhizopus microsporus]|nr:hypothetical protein G6F68_017882 [Rhizopus microsporus]